MEGLKLGRSGRFMPLVDHLKARSYTFIIETIRRPITNPTTFVKAQMAEKITMFLGSLDHTPSEQLVHQDTWHTTVLIISQAGINFQDVSGLLQMANGKPKKWSKSSDTHKKTFEANLNKTSKNYHVFAISAQGKTIEKSFEHMISELGLAGFKSQMTKNQKPYIEFGPFTRIKVVSEGADHLKQIKTPETFSLARNQALPLIFVCHFLLRTHQQFLALIQKEKYELEWMDWQIMPNKFPGDIAGPMASLFHAIMSGAARQKLVSGNIRVVTFLDPKDDIGSTLADKIAGLLDTKLKAGGQTSLWPPTIAHSGMNWEIWA